MKLSVYLAVWNGAKYLPYLFYSLRGQTFKDFKLYILDNGSSDNSADIINKELRQYGMDYVLMQNDRNIGFAKGYNMLYSKECELGGMVNDYIFILNQDIFLKSDCLEKLVGFMDSMDSTEAAVSAPVLMRWNFKFLDVKYGAPNKYDKERLEKSFTDKIDAVGLRICRNRRAVEWLSFKNFEYVLPRVRKYSRCIRVREKSAVRENRQDVSYEAVEVFGVSGAAALFRRKAIDELGRIFDNDFGSYKEDVDLAYLLRSFGHKSYVVLDAKAYHDRSACAGISFSDICASSNKKNQTRAVRYYSYKNHLSVLYKNEYWQNFILDLPWILWYELKKFVWILLFDSATLKGLVDIWKNRKTLKNKRQSVSRGKKLAWKEIRVWWNK